MKPKYVWCEQRETWAASPKNHLEDHIRRRAPKKRCPTCGKMLTLRQKDVESCGPHFELEYFWLKHKRRVK
jgi:hypothetical protein